MNNITCLHAVLYLLHNAKNNDPYFFLIVFKACQKVFTFEFLFEDYDMSVHKNLFSSIKLQYVV